MMKRKTTARRPRKSTKARVPWTSKDLAALKKLNREGQHARDIGRQLGRSEGSYAGFWVMGDQAARFAGASMTSMPSWNLTPPMTFGN